MRQGFKRLAVCRCATVRPKPRRQTSRWASSTTAVDKKEMPVIPEEPTWSVHDLLSSYPRPSISPSTLKKLHELSALRPPEEGTEAHERMRRELEELVRLVDAVKLVDTSVVDGEDRDGGFIQGIPDGRVWPEDQGMALSSNTREVEFEDKDGESGTELLKHAAVTRNGMYVVEADRRKK